MRVVYDTSGADVTTSVQNYLKANRTLLLYDLFWLRSWRFWSYNPSSQFTDMFYTSAPFPIKVAKLQSGPNAIATENATFLPARIDRGKLDYKIGLDDQSLDVNWYLKETEAIFPGPPTFKQALLAGFFQDAPLWVHQAIFTADRVLLGTTLKFRGFVQNAELAVDHIKLTLSSLMHVFQTVKVPTQLIQPGNRTPGFVPAGQFVAPNGPLAGSTQTDVLFGDIIGVAWPIPDHSLRDGYVIAAGNLSFTAPTNNSPPPLFFRIRDNITNDTPNLSNLHVYPYEPTLVDPLSLGVAMWIQDSLLNSGSGAPGFPLVPVPETAV